MASVITMPKLSDTMEEGGVAKWLKKEGDFIEEGEPFIEIETDKATMEYNSPAEGTLLKILVPAGKSCALDAPLCVVGEKGESFDLAQFTGGSKAAGAPPPPPPPAPTVSAPVAPAAAAAPSAPTPAPAAGGRLRASPLAKKMAKDKGLNLQGVKGSGPGGRVVLRDLEGLSKTSAPSAAPSMAAPMAAGAGDQVIPLTMMRKTIAKRLLAGKNDAPHFYLTVSANMSRFNEWRQRLNQQASETKISVNDLLVMAIGKALRRHPEVNASWEGDAIRQFGSVHVAVAVALPTGLVTPVVRHADQLGAQMIAKETQRLIQRAKNGELQPEEYSGGTFTISNLGMMGIEEFTAIINPPQAAILAVAATIPTPWVDDKGQIVVQPRMKMTMSCDHRVVDGAVGASFLKTLVSFLEDPLMMLG